MLHSLKMPFQISSTVDLPPKVELDCGLLLYQLLSDTEFEYSGSKYKNVRRLTWIV